MSSEFGKWLLSLKACKDDFTYKPSTTNYADGPALFTDAAKVPGHMMIQFMDEAELERALDLCHARFHADVCEVAAWWAALPRRWR